MKSRRIYSLGAVVTVLPTVLCLSVQAASLPDPVRPVVTVMATVPIASETGPSVGVFTVNRTGSTDLSLTVFYVLGGEAANGVDYEKLPGFVTIPAGGSSAAVVVRPIDDQLVEGPEKVVLTLELPPMMTMVFPAPEPPYLLGAPSQAVAVILDDDQATANVPPKIEWVKPADGSAFVAPADITLVARAQDPDGIVVSVEFFATISLGVVPYHATANPFGDDSLFWLAWTKVPVGDYSVTAVAKDNRGATTVSEPLNLKVVTGPLPPVVSVTATTASTREPDPFTKVMPGRFTIARTGSTDQPLTVYFKLGGTAQNGVDYAGLDEQITIPAGEPSADVIVAPIDDKLVEGDETVVLKLTWPVMSILEGLPAANAYTIGEPSQATVVIFDNDTPSTTQAKLVINEPKDGRVFIAPTDVTIRVTTTDPQGYISRVELFDGDQKIGEAAIDFIRAPDPGTPIELEFLWKNAPIGSHSLIARGVDSQGALVKSQPVKITVLKAEEPPGTAKIVITQPKDGQVFVAPTSIEIKATATDLQGFIYILEFYADELKIGQSVIETFAPPVPGTPAYHDFLWQSVPAGTYALTARFVNSSGATVTSEPVAITVLETPPETARTVKITQPKDGQAFVAPADILIKVTTVDPGWDYISSVELFVGEHKIGETGAFFYAAPPPGTPIDLEFMWKNAPVGSHALTARSLDGAVKSSPVNITVLNSQEPPLATIVTVTAPDPVAVEANPIFSSVQPDTATFRVTRTGSTDQPLTVYYKLSGDAINGVDYLKLPEEVTILKGESSADIGLLAVEDNLVEGPETAVLTLEDPVCAAEVPPPPGCYTVGEPGQAMVVIRDKDSGANLPPKVLITHPHDGQTFAAPADIKIAAEGRNPDGWVGKVEFFANGNEIGEVIVNFEQTPLPDETQAFTFSWSNVPAGEYALTAVGTDNQGFTGKSDPVIIKVTDSQHPPIVTVFATKPFASERGLNPATFKVRRVGSTNEPLTVRYALGGTAKNGVDYEKLDGVAIIAASRHSASIIVKPIDDAQHEPAETVVIRLEPAVPSPLYEVGRPAKAVAVIADDDPPVPKVTAFSEALHFSLPGANGSNYRVETSDDLKTWVPVFSGVVTDGAIHFTDPDSANLPHRFYRVAPEIAPVADDD